jgi:hypothetical protein
VVRRRRRGCAAATHSAATLLAFSQFTRQQPIDEFNGVDEVADGFDRGGAFAVEPVQHGRQSVISFRGTRGYGR